jgi:hypothetical protein
MASSGGGIHWDNPIPANLDRLYPQLATFIQAATFKKSADAERYMKNNAPWQDQTGNARNGLASKPFSEGTNFGMDLFHQVPYGIWLEVRFSGRYAVIDPTLPVIGGEFMSLLNGIIGRAKGG